MAKLDPSSPYDALPPLPPKADIESRAILSMLAAGIAKRHTASVYLKQFAEIGILRESQVGREKLFVHPEFLQLLMSDNHKFTRYPDSKKPLPLRNARAAPATRR